MRILIADDHELLRDALGAFMQNEDGIELHTAANFAEACTLLKGEWTYDLVLLAVSYTHLRAHET